ncbi:single-stranded DNA-binding protein [Citricoccus sp. K5]|uniref:single-stranded DNA-binding protein n=1 Tax=Citricoccus sp. K5 TaxID=2653135 RepID=UPI0012EFCD0E|nr:single-stranded DNA-binding protein [Citricoccus sp. K5]VXA93340.1 Single-stranded DNA-binding protein [Citricoccus sp. K5]VXA96053.1 Single-stranded DNA-binding protein [Citricoccus sp. K5]
MSSEQMITIRGRLTADPELRFTPSGAAVANFTIAANPRKFDKQSNEWKDGEAIFWRCTAWKDLGENIAASLVKGSAVIALAELEARSYETREGEKRTVTEARIEAMGPDLRWSTARVEKASRSSSGFGGSAPASDAGAWGGSTGGSWNTPAADQEPPF